MCLSASCRLNLRKYDFLLVNVVHRDDIGLDKKFQLRRLKMSELLERDFQISISENDFVPFSEKVENLGFMLVYVDGEVTTKI